MDKLGSPVTKLITPSDLHRAEARIGMTCLRTPVLPVPHPAGGEPLWVKAEFLQRTGSFKLRGAVNALATLSQTERASGVVTFRPATTAEPWPMRLTSGASPRQW